MTFADLATEMLNLPFKFLSLKVFLSDFDAKLEDLFVPYLHVSINLVHCILQEVHFIHYSLSFHMLHFIIVVDAQHFSLQDLLLPFDIESLRLLPRLLLHTDLLVHQHLLFNRFAFFVSCHYLPL